MLLTLFLSVLSSLSISQQVDTMVVHYLSSNMADFPDNFTEYWNLYCDPNAPLYYSSQEIALELYNSDIDKTILCNKLMAIAVDAVWEVDNIACVQYTLWQFIKNYPNIFIAGQISGVEGYVESAGSGLYAAINMAQYLNGGFKYELGSDTMMGAMANYISDRNKGSEPTYADDYYIFFENNGEALRKDKKAIIRNEKYFNQFLILKGFFI